jgi:hypothetical protein
MEWEAGAQAEMLALARALESVQAPELESAMDWAWEVETELEIALDRAQAWVAEQAPSGSPLDPPASSGHPRAEP